MLGDSSIFVKEDLHKNKATRFIIFGPDCEHCQDEARQIMARQKELKDLQIIMVSILPNKFNRPFFDEYGLAAVPNIKLGTDLTYQLRKLYQVKTLPAMYVYDLDRNLAKAFVGNINVPAIIDAVK